MARSPLTGLFGRSPFAGLARHTERVHETVELIRPLFESYLEEDWDAAERIYEQISRLEHEADRVKSEIRDHLPTSLFLPVDRGDLLLFLKEQDAIADRAEDVGVILTMRRTRAPAALREPLTRFVDHVIATSEAWYETARDLPVLQEVAFTGPEVQKTLDRVERISNLEFQADRMQAAAARKIFEHEQELGAVSVLIWMHALEVVGDIANRAENTADLLRLMLARR